MQNALAVYAPKAPLNGGKLAKLAMSHEVSLRFLSLGGYLPADPDSIQKKSLANGGALLLIGGFPADAATLLEFDRFVELGDRLPIAEMLNGGKLPWCELYVDRFDYEKKIAAAPKDKAKIDNSVPKKQLAALKGAKTRYIIYNQSRKKNGGQLMTTLANALTAATGGVLADFQRPSR